MTEHKPLVGIFAKPIYKLSPRLQRMRTKLLWYDLDITCVPDKGLYVADALSRAIVSNTLIEPEQKLNEFRDATGNYPVLQTLLHVILSGWPAVKGDLPDCLYLRMRCLVCCKVSSLNFILGIDNPSDPQFNAADINGDGILNILDIIATVNIILDS